MTGKLGTSDSRLGKIILNGGDIQPLYNANVSESLSFVETYSKTKHATRTISETIDITESINRSIAINRNISEHLFIIGGMPRTYHRLGYTNPPIYWIPEVQGMLMPTRCTVILECPATNSAIILPCPELGDIEKSMHSQVVKRSMTGDLYTYVRRNDLQELKYDFVLGRGLVYRLQDFANLNIAEIITMTNWKAEIWKVQIMNNPLEFVAKSLFENEGERWEVNIEFQGLRLF